MIEAGKKYFPTVAAAWDDPRVTLECGDGAVFMKREDNIGKFDVIITDSSDPVGPAQALFESPFYTAMNNALRPGGKVCTQAESMWLHLPLIQKLIKDSSRIFENVEYATTQIPTYPAGQIGLLLCSKAGGKSAKTCTKPARRIKRTDEDQFHYYSSDLHSQAFVLPHFAAKACAEAREEALKEIAEHNKLKRKSSQGKGKAAEAEAEADDNNNSSSSSSNGHKSPLASSSSPSKAAAADLASPSKKKAKTDEE